MSDEFGYESLGSMRVVAMTDLAICFEDPMEPHLPDVWVPRSVMEDTSMFKEVGDEDEVFVREWWYEQEIA